MSTNGTTTMHAVRFHGQRDIRLDQVPRPTTIKPGWIQLSPQFCGICGTDLHEFLGGANIIPSAGHPHPITGETLPLTIGHEFSAIVDAVGEGITHVQPGDRVCVQPTIWDDECRSCKRGLVNCCDSNGFLGLSGWGGGMAETTLAPATAVKRLPDNISLEVGALIEPLAVGWHAVSISPYKEGDSVLVIGGGPIGLCTVQALISRGCKNVIVLEVAKRRREFATQFGAHHVIDPTSVDVVTEVEKLTGGLGADLGFDCAGVQVAVDSAFKAIKARGMLVNVAVWEKRATLNMNDIVFRERAYMGVATYDLGDFEAVIEAISAGKMKPEAMITKKVAMDKVAEEGFKTLIEDKDNHVKVLVDMTQPVG
ncbi:hypothetical protein N0V93_009764 [Gnomoniopsis smithogilvyi]|uniref:Enoyl reductase (ER) domain-containing protein n=1 Tax=Gnomoniopsis smithogilvyi TaxID=1191159 RepID=A0A9W8YLN4_9PEZI|nr:hypothetical protein N0V93_009764 [Gnomoniopsis smithogilvyi]